MIKKLVIIALILFLVSCQSMPPRDILIHEGTIKSIDIFRGSKVRYLSIVFEDDYHVLLESMKNNIQPGEEGKLYVKILKGHNFVYCWEKL